jgi:UDP-N-acetylmuramoylalanine--D-glutamate ligase
MGKSDLTGKRVVILGLARQGKSLARYLARYRVQVTISDLRDEATLADTLAELKGLPIRYVLGEHPTDLLDGTDLVCLSGGVPVDIPFVMAARERGIPLSNEAQVFLDRCPAPVIGITGSAGKTAGRAWVGGNIGNPLIDDLDEIRPGDRVVMELSSFQLELMTVSPHVAAVLNITPNHLDRHGTMKAYIDAKRHIVSHQKADDFAILGYDDANARSLALDTDAQVVWFSGGAEVEQGAFRADDELILRLQGRDITICHVSEIKLLGRHNLLNVLASCALAGVSGVPVEAMQRVATTFTGVEHRLELTRELDGVRWYDDSIATAPERSLAALRSFTEPIVLLAGGRDKKLPWGDFANEAVQRVRHLVTFGEAGPMIAQVVQKALNGGIVGAQLEGVTQVETLEEAVEAAARIAQSGDVVLLSPGGTSFDAFQDFAERGARFKALVRQL